MNKLSNLLLASTALVAAGPALAASSGNFTASDDNFNCTINSANGSFNSGSTAIAAGTVFEIGKEAMQINISNGNGTALVITPSLVTGLFTENQITSKSATSTQDVGIQVQVNVMGPGPIKIAPVTTGDAGNLTDTGATCTPETAPAGQVSKASCVIYDQRFVQVSSSLFQNITGCSTTLSVTTVTGTATTHTTIATCFQMIQSTLSAHAFNFYVQAPGGSYTVDVDAQLFVGNGNTLNGSIAGCAGPGTITVQQVKNFSFDTPISF
jgi:hypothetical protein